MQTAQTCVRSVVNDLQVDGNARCFSSRLGDLLKLCVCTCEAVPGVVAVSRGPLCGLIPFLPLRHSHAESLHAPLQRD